LHTPAGAETPNRLRGNIRRLYLFSFLKMMLFPMAIITLFWKDHIGLSLTDIMLLQGAFSLASLCLEYPSGYLSDRLGYRFSLNLASALGIVGWGVYTLADSFSGVLLAEILLGISFAFISGSDSALLFETLRADGREVDYRKHDGAMTACAQTGEAVGAIFAGLLYATTPLLPFFLQVAVWLMALLVTVRMKEPEAAPAISHSHLQEALRTWNLAWRDSPSLRSTILLATCLGLASFYPVWLIQPYMQQCGLPISWFGPVWAGANLTVALFSIASHSFSLRLGDRGLLIATLLLTAVGYLGLGLTGGLFSFLFYYLLTAMRGLQGPFIRQYLQREGQRSNRASLLSLKALAFRLGFVISAPAVGIAADAFGIRATFLLLTPLVAGAALLAAISFVRRNLIISPAK